MNTRERMSPERRAQISAATKAAMASPEVRERISERTKAGMAAASGAAIELRTLRAVWRAARPSVRKQFLDELLAPAYSEPPR